MTRVLGSTPALQQCTLPTRGLEPHSFMTETPSINHFLTYDRGKENSPLSSFCIKEKKRKEKYLVFSSLLQTLDRGVNCFPHPPVQRIIKFLIKTHCVAVWLYLTFQLYWIFPIFCMRTDLMSLAKSTNEIHTLCFLQALSNRSSREADFKNERDFLGKTLGIQGNQTETFFIQVNTVPYVVLRKQVSFSCQWTFTLYKMEGAFLHTSLLDSPDSPSVLIAFHFKNEKQWAGNRLSYTWRKPADMHGSYVSHTLKMEHH